MGLVTGSGSDALHDIINISYRRNPLLRFRICPSLVQGPMAPKNLISSVQLLVQSRVDLIVLSRGGGSSEDLWAFNDPELITFLHKVPVPIITGIGHQMDTTLVISLVLEYQHHLLYRKDLIDLKTILNALHVQITNSLLQYVSSLSGVLPPPPLVNTKITHTV